MNTIVLFAVGLAVFFIIATFVILITRRDKPTLVQTPDEEDESIPAGSYATFERIENPYIAGNAIDKSELFFGRDETIDHIREVFINTDGRQSIILYGERRIGKTSLLFQLDKFNRLGDRFIPVYFSMEEMALSDASYGYSLSARILKEIAKAIVRKIGLTGNFPEPTFSSVDIGKAFDEFEAYIHAIKTYLGERFIVLLIDEYEILRSKINDKAGIDDRFHAGFKRLIDNGNKICFIFTGSESLVSSKDLIPVTYRARTRSLESLSPSEARDLVEKPVAEKVRYQESAIREIMDLTSNHPFYIQCICLELIMILNQKKKNFVTNKDVDDAVKSLLINIPPHLNDSWTSLPSGEHKIVIAILGQLLSTNETATPLMVQTALKERFHIDYDEQKIGDILDSLTQDGSGILRKDGEQDSYCFRVKLVRKLIASKYTVYTALRESKTGV